jgi:hypothetical protein
MYDHDPFYDRHPKAFGWLFVGVLLIISGIVGWLLKTQVTVSLLWPVGASVLAGWLALRNVQKTRELRRHFAEQAERRRMEHEDRPRLTAWEFQRGGWSGERVGTAERLAVTDVLGDHYAEGRLDDAEFERRRDAALVAVVRRDLTALLSDLP